ncbi:MAG: TRAP transporter substrate-binding protein DctP, partial [Deltaproteobacteria bacterium]|nr:TRAP transporter substrate-binding protein DctP [Deltaproteobacteria bacterium]
MRYTRLWLLGTTLALCLTALAGPARAADEIVVKMATLAPDGSSWHLTLKEMGEKWKAISKGKVVLRIYPGGVAGDDGDVVRKIRLGTLNAASLGSSGLADIDRSVLALQVPMMYASYAEFDHVLEKMSPRIEKSYLSKGYVLLSWADAGWVHFFTKTPVRVPEDLKSLKLFVWGGSNEVTDIWKAAGFNPVPLPSTEISTALQTGLVSALPTTPQAAVLLQWYNHAKNMTDVRWAVLLGGTVISKSVWDKIPADLHPALLQAAREAGQKIRNDIRASAVRDVEAMKKRGVNVVHVDAAGEALWVKAAESAYPKARGVYCPPDAFDEAMKYRDELRKKKGA